MLQLGLNSLADLTHEEYKQRFLGYKPSLRKPANSARLGSFSYADVADEQLPRAVDWRALKAVAEVKNQQQVGAASAGGMPPSCTFPDPGARAPGAPTPRGAARHGAD